jgi:hypothetical protein
VRSVSPEFLKAMILGDRTPDEVASALSEGDPRVAGAGDLAKVLAANMAWYVEWPHVDGRFIQVFHTLAGYSAQSGWTRTSGPR